MDDRTTNSTDGRVERAKDAALGKHDSNPSHLDEAGEGVGGIGGVLTGAAIGSAIGPVGTIIGGIAGAVGGWWAGRAVTEAASNLSKGDDEYYRSAYEKAPNRLADRSYDDVRPAYVIGHLASQNPDYAGRSWDDVSGDLQKGWTADNAKAHGEWSTVKSYAGDAYARGRTAVGNAKNAVADAGRTSPDASRR